MALTPEQEALDYNPELQGLSRERKLAELLMAKGMQQPQGQMISGYYVAPSWSQQLNPMANVLAGEAISGRADTKQTQYAAALRTQGDAAVKDIMDTYEQSPKAALTKATQNQQYPQVKAILPQLSKVGINESPTSKQEFDEAKADGFPGNYSQFLEWSANLKAPKTSITNAMPPAESAYSTEMGKGAAKQDLALKDIAENSNKTIENIHNQRKLLDTGKVITGFGADQMLGLAQFGKAVGLTGKNDKDLASNTQSFLAGRAGSTLDAIQSSNLGSAQGFSNTDREFLQAAKLGGIKYDEKSLRRQLDLEERVARAATEKWNQRVKSMPKSASAPINMTPVELPGAYQMEGVDKSNPLLR
jgi:hypothetical protein